MIEKRSVSVLDRDNGVRDWPFNTQIRVVPADATFMSRRIKVRALIKEISLTAEHSIAVSKVRRDVERLLVLIGEDHSRPPFERGGAPPDIHDHIENFS
jgi:hypothetical protein